MLPCFFFLLPVQTGSALRSNQAPQGSVLSGIDINPFWNGQGTEDEGNEDLNAIHFSLGCFCSRRILPNPPQEGVSDFAMGEQRRHQNVRRALVPKLLSSDNPTEKGFMHHPHCPKSQAGLAELSPSLLYFSCGVC